MKILKSLILAASLTLCGTASYAQSTASESITGYLTTSGCPSGLTVCFKQYGSTGGTGAIVNQGNPNAGGVLGWFMQMLDGAGNALTSTLSGGKQALDVNLTNTFNSNGQAVMASSAPVAIASDQSPISTSAGCAGATVANTKTKPFSNAASSSNLLLVTGVSAKKTYICAIKYNPVGAAVNIALVEGTTVTNACDTTTLGLDGGATAATGNLFVANEGETFGNGVGLIAATTVNANNVCLLFSSGVQVSGVITYTTF